jgi:hypothetical protein
MSNSSQEKRLSRTAGHAGKSPTAYPATAAGRDQLAWTLPGEFERLPDPQWRAASASLPAVCALIAEHPMEVKSHTKAESGKRKAVPPESALALTTAFRFPLSAFPPIRFLALAAVLIASAALPGCRSWNPWGKGFDDEYANLGAKARSGSSTNPGAPSLGLSAKSRQIERNLGIE